MASYALLILSWVLKLKIELDVAVLTGNTIEASYVQAQALKPEVNAAFIDNSITPIVGFE